MVMYDGKGKIPTAKPAETYSYTHGSTNSPLVNCREEDALIKVEVSPSDKESYFIKTGKDGSLYNPWGRNVEFHVGGATRHGDNIWKFKKVSSYVYESYSRFLVTRNSSYLLQAEREVRSNG